MKISKPIIGIIIGIVMLVFWIIGSYNGLVNINEQVNTAWAQVETQYQRRYDLIPNLVEATKGVLTQEQAVFTAIANARQGYAGAKTSEEKVEAAQRLDSSLARLLVIVENYPELKSDQTVKALMDELAGTENRISVERRRYNESVQTYNVKVKSIPTVLIAAPMGFAQKKFYESVAEADTAPKVDLKL